MNNLWPQMSPLWWTTLMISFIILLMFIMTILYFNYYTKMDSKVKLIVNKINWKW